MPVRRPDGQRAAQAALPKACLEPRGTFSSRLCVPDLCAMALRKGWTDFLLHSQQRPGLHGHVHCLCMISHPQKLVQAQLSLVANMSLP